MNRILRRPMFRMGGSTSGITSGLDAPRKQFANGSLDEKRKAWHVQPWKYLVTQKNLQNMKDNWNQWNWQMTYPNFV